MQQFKPYFTGKANPMKDFGTKNVASIQKCFRTSDIDEVGDESHLTFFEMLGHFSFGDYFKKETVEWTYELLTKTFSISSERISVTVFEGDGTVPFDEESFLHWSNFLPKERIQKGSRESNFWGPAGSEGPCGACNEVYVDGVELATLVFMEYYCAYDGSLTRLSEKGVDVGWGLERVAAVLQNKKDIFETDLFAVIMEMFPVQMEMRRKRIFADHARGVAFLISDGVRPSNKEAGYVLRRLMRRMIVHAYLEKERGAIDIPAVLRKTVHLYSSQYPELDEERILDEFAKENDKFATTLSQGVRELNRLDVIDASAAFKLYESFGLPYEIIKELGRERAALLDRNGFQEEFKKHQEISRAGQEKKFGGHGLLLNTGELKAGDEEELKKVTRLHTATHLLQQALRDVLGKEVRQMGSDITAERTRFDFTFPRKLTKEEIQKVEDIVNTKIKEDLPVSFKELPKEDAERTGALFFFKEKYPERVKVYYVGKTLESAWSKEFCGGPHVSHTGEIGVFRIIKEEAVGAGVRRIRGAISEERI